MPTTHPLPSTHDDCAWRWSELRLVEMVLLCCVTWVLRTIRTCLSLIPSDPSFRRFIWIWWALVRVAPWFCFGKRSAESAEFQASRCCICRLVPGTHVKSWSPLNYTGVHQGRDQTTFEYFWGRCHLDDRMPVVNKSSTTYQDTQRSKVQTDVSNISAKRLLTVPSSFATSVMS